MDKETILERYRALKLHLDDSRPSQDVRPTGSTFRMAGSAFVETAKYRHKRRFVILLEALLEHVAGTKGFKQFIHSAANYQYNVAVSSLILCGDPEQEHWSLATEGFKEFVRSAADDQYNPTVSPLILFGDPEQQDWDIFDLAKVHLLEKETLARALQAALQHTGVLGDEAIDRQILFLLIWVKEFQAHYQAPQEFQEVNKPLQAFIDQKDAL